jgi:hypothetical protein
MVTFVDQGKEVVSAMGATARLKTHFGLQHLVGAALFARKALEIECTLEEIVGSGEPEWAHRAYVTGAVFSAAASLEATINEVYLGTLQGDPTAMEKTDPRFAIGLVRDWRRLERKSILRKYQEALGFAEVSKFEEDDPLYKDVDGLIQLRHALVHYKPEWNTDQKKHKETGDALEGRFEPNPFAGPNDAFFPKKCLGHECAKWAVQSSLAFMNEFFRRVGLPTIPSEERQDREEVLELLRTR